MFQKMRKGSLLSTKDASVPIFKVPPKAILSKKYIHLKHDRRSPSAIGLVLYFVLTESNRRQEGGEGKVGKAFPLVASPPAPEQD